MNSLPGTSGRRRIYLLRHGAVNYFRDDGTRLPDAHLVQLTEEGRSQAEAMRALLSGAAFDRAVSSGMNRSRETAERVLGPDRSLPVESVDAFREIMLGHIDEIPPDRLDAEFTYGFETAAQPGARFGRGESYAEFCARVWQAFEALLKTPDWTRLLLVAHGGTNRAILSWVTQGGLASFAHFEQDECCLNVIDVDLIDGVVVRRYLRVMNLTPYNLDKEGMFRTSLERVVDERARRAGVRG